MKFHTQFSYALSILCAPRHQQTVSRDKNPSAETAPRSACWLQLKLLLLLLLLLRESPRRMHTTADWTKSAIDSREVLRTRHFSHTNARLTNQHRPAHDFFFPSRLFSSSLVTITVAPAPTTGWSLASPDSIVLRLTSR